MKKLNIPLFIILILSVFSIFADEEASNIPYVKSGTWGRAYAKSVPLEYYGEKGITKIYSVTKDEDKLVCTFDWYSRQIYLQGNLISGRKSGVSIVRFGPWARGRFANKDELALAFYFNDELLKSYSTLDIAGSKENVQASVSHYTVIKDVSGYRWVDSNTYVFEIVTIDGRTLSFDAVTGDIKSK